MQDTGLVVTAVLCLASEDFSHFSEKFISHLCGNRCFGVWPKHSYFNLFEGGLLCLKK